MLENDRVYNPSDFAALREIGTPEPVNIHIVPIFVAREFSIRSNESIGRINRYGMARCRQRFCQVGKNPGGYYGIRIEEMI